ncbi:unnamed protein product [Darwinula stevensoni]|uniref:Peptidase S1 domain-containing protein n=1 Tax=Darwinula stevensoni TaxID=69355 RepID=A0A7R8XF29_9CRUS|nr:unnamed protein product [Darwinula stevensoni]CAG0895087.1 unnamed protein product [Darwinula stevensoni]
MTPKLHIIDLQINLLTSLPDFKSDSLEILYVNDNKITNVNFDRWATPKLRVLQLGKNLLTSIPVFRGDNLEILSIHTNHIASVVFNGLVTANLKELILNDNLLTSFPAFESDSLEILYLQNNKINSVEFDRWRTHKLKIIFLHNNSLTSFPAFNGYSLEVLTLRENNITRLEFDGSETPNLRELHLEDNSLTSVPAFKSDSLELLALKNNKITNVEFDGWVTPNLKKLYLYENLLTSLPAVKSDSLEVLSLFRNNITSVEFDGWATPKLKDLSLGINPMLRFPFVAMKGLKNLEKLWWWECNLGPTLSRDLLEFQSTALKLVDLSNNGISRLEQGAISGVEPDTEIYLNDNKIAVLSEETFRPILQILSRGNGVLVLIVHNNYNIHNYDSDIALLKLADPSILTERVQLICIPTRFDISEDTLEHGRRGWVAGWGYDGSDNLTAVLTEVQLPVISNPICIQDTIKITGNSSAPRTLTSNMFCAGHATDVPLEDYRTVCPGDSGSPMVFFSRASVDSHWTVEGIVSHFLQKQKCSLRQPGQYGIFTKVNQFIQWIEDALFKFSSE